MNLRPVVPTDVELLAALHRFGPPPPWDADSFAGLLATPRIYGFLAGEAEPEGFVLCRVAADEAEILTIVVAPERRRNGVGRALVEAAEAVAREHGAATMFLEVATDNAPARAFYAALGFDPVGRRPRYYGGAIDALILYRRLDI